MLEKNNRQIVVARNYIDIVPAFKFKSNPFSA